MTIDLAAWPHEYQPAAPGAPLLLLLHGTGGNEHEIKALAENLDPDAGVLAPRGRVIEHGMNRWFRRLAEGVFDLDDVEVRADELAQFVTAALAEYGILGDAPSSIVAVGFSNGANIALATAMRHPEVVPRVIAFSGMYPFGDREPAKSLSALSVLLLNGASDPMAPRSSVQRLVGALEGGGARVTRIEREGGHGIAESDLDEARRWLKARGWLKVRRWLEASD